MSTDKTLITYLGGTGGDFIATCCNNFKSVGLRDTAIVDSSKFAFTIKPYETQLKHQPEKLADLIAGFKNPFITTHLYRSLKPLGLPVISLVVNDKDMQEVFILRQMRVQWLQLDKSTKDLSIYSVVKNYCLKGNFEKAAKFMFEFARKRWLTNQDYRLNNPLLNSTVVDVSNIFSSEGFLKIINELPITDESRVSAVDKHRIWAQKQPELSYKDTIDHMTEKLSKMDFNNPGSVVQYQQ